MDLIAIKDDCFFLSCLHCSLGEFVEVNFTGNLAQDRWPSQWVQLPPMLVPIAPQHNSNCTPQLPLFFFQQVKKQGCTTWWDKFEITRQSKSWSNKGLLWDQLWRGVRSDAQLSSTETRFQKCSQSGKTGSKHPMLSISMAFNVISCKKIERNTQKLKIADFTM